MKRAALTYGRLALGIGIGVGLGWFSIRGLDWGLVVDHLSRVSALTLALSLTVFMASGVVRAARWRMLFMEPRPSVARLFIVQHEGLGLSNIMPLRVASELTQIAVLTIKDGLRASTVLAAIGMERAVDFLSSMLIFGIAFMFVPEMRPLAPYVLGTMGIGLTLIGALQVLAWRGESIWLVRRITFLVAFSNALKDLAQDWRLLLQVFGASVAYWLMVGVSAWIASDAIGLPISPLTATLVIIGDDILLYSGTCTERHRYVSLRRRVRSRTHRCDEGRRFSVRGNRPPALLRATNHHHGVLPAAGGDILETEGRRAGSENERGEGVRGRTPQMRGPSLYLSPVEKQ